MHIETIFIETIFMIYTILVGVAAGLGNELGRAEGKMNANTLNTYVPTEVKYLSSSHKLVAMMP